jgi:hypothetical protein
MTSWERAAHSRPIHSLRLTPSVVAARSICASSASVRRSVTRLVERGLFVRRALPIEPPVESLGHDHDTPPHHVDFDVPPNMLVEEGAADPPT